MQVTVCACVCVCVTLTRIFRTSGSDTLFFPNFWMLKDATFMVAAEENKKRQKEKGNITGIVMSLFVSQACVAFLYVHQTSYYMCACVLTAAISHETRQLVSSSCLRPVYNTNTAHNDKNVAV